MSITFNTIAGLGIILGAAILGIAVMIGAVWVYSALNVRLSWAVYMSVILIAVAYLINYTIRSK